MRYKIFFTLLALLLIGTMGVFFLLSSSYQHSFQAKLEYLLGHYEKAQNLATKAHKEDSYNRMAATIMTQSALAIEYVTYINDGKAYLEKIALISSKEYVEKADKIRMKFMSEIMIERYAKLTETVVISEDLKKSAQAIFSEFVQIHEKVLRSL